MFLSDVGNARRGIPLMRRFLGAERHGGLSLPDDISLAGDHDSAVGFCSDAL